MQENLHRVGIGVTALALREGAAFFSSQRGACHRDVERFMKHPQVNLV